MLHEKHLKEAEHIVKGVAWCREALTYTDTHPHQSQILVMKAGGTSTYDHAQAVHISKKARAAAFRVWRAEVEEKLAEHRRRAAQIGLVLE